MSSDTNQAIRDTTARGERSKSSCARPRGFLPSMSSQSRYFPPRRNTGGRFPFFLVRFLLPAVGIFFVAGASAQQQQAPISPSQQPPPPSAPPQDIPQGAYKIKSQVS